MNTSNDETYISKLQTTLSERKRKNPAYSVRALARDIGADAGDLVNIMNGKKKVTPKMAYKIGSHLGLQGNALLDFILPTLK